jgi:3-hydroxyacyl-CoA dehydrogenase
MNRSQVTIRSAAVLGAGTMGAQIAAHLANAGLSVQLLDVSTQAARDGLERARKLKPDPFFTPDSLTRIRTGGFDEDLAVLNRVDWIVEAIVEQADVKRGLLERVDGVRRPGSIVSSNTSGLSIAALAEGRSQDFRRHWLGTHFFNPPRYLQLLELISTSETDSAVATAVADFADHRLGKNVVVAKDAPGFIANHIAMHNLARIFQALATGEYTVEEIDAVTGPAIGRPKSATFRTVDIAGLDVLVRVAADLVARLPPSRAADFTFPPFVAEMVKRGWIGEKAGRGVYER